MMLHTCAVVRRSATADPARYLELGLIGLDGLITTQRVQTATTPVTVLADIYTFKQSIAATRFMRTPSWRCTRTSSGRNGPLLGKQGFWYIWRSSLGVTKPNAQLDLLRIAS